MSSSLIPFDSPKWALSSGSTSHSTSSPSSHSIITLLASSKTDWWRTSRGSKPESNVNRRSGPVYSLKVDSTKAFKAGVWMRGHLKERFQQVCLFLYSGDEFQEKDAEKDETNWLKAGVELEDGKENIGCVVTSPYSDWSISPAQTQGISYSSNSADSDQWLFIQISRPGEGPDISVHTAQAPSSSGKGRDSLPPTTRPEEKDMILIREVRGFDVLNTNGKEKVGGDWRIGVLTCGPLSEATEGRFADFFVEYD